MVDRRAWLVVYVKGVAMGTADAVPGVSGGTIALIVGIYERLIAAITAIDASTVRRVLAGVTPANWSDARDAILDADAPFLIVLGAGIATAIVVVLRVVDVLLRTVPVPTYGFFFGLIGASAVVLYGVVDLSTTRRKAAALAGFTLAFLTSGYAATAVGHGLPILFVAGAIAVSAMVLPGISGSLLLVILGQYEFMSGALSRFIDSLLGLVSNGTSGIESVLTAAPPVMTFIAGAIVGLFTVAHAVRRALERARAATLAFLVSLIVGALRAPVVEVSMRLSERGETWGEALPAFVLAAVVGALVVLLLDRYAGTLQY